MTDNLPIIFRGNSNEVNEYESSQISYFKLNGVVLSNTTTKCDISQTILAKEINDDTIIQFIVSNQQNEGQLENIKHITDFLKKIESVTESLVLEINHFGEINKVVNKEELLKKWTNLKRDLKTDAVFNNMTSENQALIINQGDLEYDMNFPYQHGIKKSLIFYNLIFPFYGSVFSEENKYGSFKSQRNSSIVQHVKIDLDNDVLFYESDDKNEIRIHSSYNKNMDLVNWKVN